MTLGFHREITALAKDGAHGWERVLDRGRGTTMMDSLGPLAHQVRESLRRALAELGPADELEINADADVLCDWDRIGNVGSDTFPAFLDTFAQGRNTV